MMNFQPRLTFVLSVVLAVVLCSCVKKRAQESASVTAGQIMVPLEDLASDEATNQHARPRPDPIPSGLHGESVLEEDRVFAVPGIDGGVACKGGKKIRWDHGEIGQCVLARDLVFGSARFAALEPCRFKGNKVVGGRIAVPSSINGVPCAKGSVKLHQETGTLSLCRLAQDHAVGETSIKAGKEIKLDKDGALR